MELLNLNEDLYKISKAISNCSREDLFSNLVKSIAETFQSKYAFIGLLDPEKKNVVTTLSLVADGEIVDNMSYGLLETPSFNVYDKEPCVYISGVRDIFFKNILLRELGVESYLAVPIFSSTNEPLGLLVILDDKSMTYNPNWTQILSIFTNRIGIELERINFEDKLALKNAELNQINDQLLQYAYMISHNLRSPISNIIGLTNLLMEFKEDKLDFDTLEHISTSVKRLDEVVKDLNKILDLNNSAEEKLEKVKFDELAKLVLEGLKKEMRECAAVVNYDFTLCESIFSIKPYIHNLFFNLLTNSFKYRHPDRGPVISISSIYQDKKCILSFEDNGLGIDLDLYSDKIFKINQRFHKGIEGKGLGLFMVKKQVELLKGEIKIDSKPNMGTKFHIILPHGN